MPGSRPRVLLIILACAAAAAGIGITIFLGMERLSASQLHAGQYQSQIARLQRSLRPEGELASVRDVLKAELKERRSRYYRHEEMNPYTFGALVRKRLVSNGLSVVRYQLVELKGESSLEFTVSGPAVCFIHFLKEVSESKKYWAISSLALSMRGSTAVMDAVFRIGYEVLSSESG
jgi:hypothetical protein